MTSSNKDNSKVDAPPHASPFFNQEKDTLSHPKEDDVDPSPDGSESIAADNTEELAKVADGLVGASANDNKNKMEQGGIGGAEGASQ